MESANQLIVILEGPSGIGKTTIMDEIVKRYPNQFSKPINATTRQMRVGESQNNPYYFINKEEFFRLRESGEIFEHTMRHGTYRGMRKSDFDRILGDGKIPIRDCDHHGIAAIKKRYGDIVLSIYMTTDKEEIRRRLISRNEPEESIIERLNDYEASMENAKYYDHVIENNDKEKAISDILNLINMYKKIF